MCTETMAEQKCKVQYIRYRYLDKMQDIPIDWLSSKFKADSEVKTDIMSVVLATNLLVRINLFWVVLHHRFNINHRARSHDECFVGIICSNNYIWVSGIVSNLNFTVQRTMTVTKLILEKC